jgi:hypothetical protein
MDRRAFMLNFNSAADKVVEFTRLYVTQSIPDDVVFRVYPNSSYDGNPLVGDQELFPQDSEPLTKAKPYLGPMSFQDAVAFMWRNGKVPEWVDVSIEDVIDHQSIVGLACCGRFTAEVERLYHSWGGIPPFSVKGPFLPPGWESLEKTGKFDLRWRHKPASEEPNTEEPKPGRE